MQAESLSALLQQQMLFYFFTKFDDYCNKHQKWTMVFSYPFLLWSPCLWWGTAMHWKKETRKENQLCEARSSVFIFFLLKIVIELMLYNGNHERMFLLLTFATHSSITRDTIGRIKKHKQIQVVYLGAIAIRIPHINATFALILSHSHSQWYCSLVFGF